MAGCSCTQPGLLAPHCNVLCFGSIRWQPHRAAPHPHPGTSGIQLQIPPARPAPPPLPPCLRAAGLPRGRRLAAAHPCGRRRRRHKLPQRARVHRCAGHPAHTQGASCSLCYPFRCPSVCVPGVPHSPPVWLGAGSHRAGACGAGPTSRCPTPSEQFRASHLPLTRSKRPLPFPPDLWTLCRAQRMRSVWRLPSSKRSPPLRRRSCASPAAGGGTSRRRSC